MNSSPIRNNTTVAPQKTPAALTTWWRAELAEHGYLCYRVEVVSSQRTEQAFPFSFKIVGHDQLFSVDLHLSNKVIWPERPSTAQLAAEGEYGFLLIDPLWLKDQLTGPLPMNGGKWPITAGDELHPELATEAATELKEPAGPKRSDGK